MQPWGQVEGGTGLLTGQKTTRVQDPEESGISKTTGEKPTDKKEDLVAKIGTRRDRHTITNSPQGETENVRSVTGRKAAKNRHLQKTLHSSKYHHGRPPRQRGYAKVQQANPSQTGMAVKHVIMSRLTPFQVVTWCGKDMQEKGVGWRRAWGEREATKGRGVIYGYTRRIRK